MKAYTFPVKSGFALSQFSDTQPELNLRIIRHLSWAFINDRTGLTKLGAQGCHFDWEVAKLYVPVS